MAARAHAQAGQVLGDDLGGPLDVVPGEGLVLASQHDLVGAGAHVMGQQFLDGHVDVGGHVLHHLLDGENGIKAHGLEDGEDVAVDVFQQQPLLGEAAAAHHQLAHAGGGDQRHIPEIQRKAGRIPGNVGDGLAQLGRGAGVDAPGEVQLEGAVGELLLDDLHVDFSFSVRWSGQQVIVSGGGKGFDSGHRVEHHRDGERPNQAEHRLALRAPQSGDAEVQVF